jgi:hypothetical protein
MAVKIKRMPSDNVHLDQKWLVLEGTHDVAPVVKRRSINTAALVSGDLSIESEIAALTADVEEYAARWEAVQEALKALE